MPQNRMECLAVTKVIDTLTEDDFYGAFQNLLEQYKCIAANGNLFNDPHFSAFLILHAYRPF